MEYDEYEFNWIWKLNIYLIEYENWILIEYENMNLIAAHLFVDPPIPF